MATISTIGKIGYIYNDGVWHPIAGMTDTSADFSWTGEHDFNDAVNFDGAVVINGVTVIKNSLNTFANATARDTAIPSPQNGTFAFVVNGSTLQPQYYYGGQWTLFGSNANITEKTSNYTLVLSDAGKTLDFNLSSGASVTVPLDSAVNFPIGSQIAFVQSNLGQITFSGQTSQTDSVTIYSKNNNKKTATRYTQALLVKKAANTWYLFGDLTA